MLTIRNQEYEAILAYCRDQLPEEACGLLGGRKEGEDSWVEKIYFLTNTDHSWDHFFMEPREQFKAVKDMRFFGYLLLGNFHSHPNSPAIPSQEDGRLAYDSKLRYLIVSLEGEPVLKSFVLKDGMLREEELCIL